MHKENRSLLFGVVPNGNDDAVGLDLDTMKRYLVQDGQVVQFSQRLNCYFLVTKSLTNRICLHSCHKLGIAPATVLHNYPAFSKVDISECKALNAEAQFSSVELEVASVVSEFEPFNGEFGEIRIRKITCNYFCTTFNSIELELCLLYDGNVIYLPEIGFFIVETSRKVVVKEKVSFPVETDEIIISNLPSIVLSNIIHTESIAALIALFKKYDEEDCFSLLVNGEFGIGKLASIQFVLHLFGINAFYLDGFKIFGVDKRINLDKLPNGYNYLVILDLQYFLFDKNMEYKPENGQEFKKLLAKLKTKFQRIICLSESMHCSQLFDVVYRMKYLTEHEVSLIWSRLNNDKSNLEVPIDHLSASNLTFLDLQLALNRPINHVRKAKCPAAFDVCIPQVKWEDVGGLESVKESLIDIISYPTLHNSLFSDGAVIKKSAVLFFGPPGTGKTMLAKAIASQFSMNFISIKGPELLNMYIGESESNIRKVFHSAMNCRPCIIFFDEIDSLLPNRSSTDSGSGSAMDRIVSQFITEFDAICRLPDVFVIGATNRKDLIDAALMRSGRFDMQLELGRAGTFEEKLKIFESVVNAFTNIRVSLSVPDKSEAISRCKEEMSGAEIYELVMTAFQRALKMKINQINCSYDLVKDKMCLFQFINCILSKEELLLELQPHHFQSS